MLMKSILGYSLLLLLASCASHRDARTLETQEVNRTHWGVLVDMQDKLVSVEDCLFITPIPSLWGDSMTIPPNPPAPSFHYVCLSDSAPPPSPILVMRKKSVTSEVSHGKLQAKEQAKEQANEMVERVSEKEVTRQPFIPLWCKILIVILFVDIIVLNVDFVCRFRR